jgi:hypothetical protein
MHQMHRQRLRLGIAQDQLQPAGIERREDLVRRHAGDSDACGRRRDRGIRRIDRKARADRHRHGSIAAAEGPEVRRVEAIEHDAIMPSGDRT